MTIQFNKKSGARGIEWTDETRNPIGGCMHECAWELPCEACYGIGELSHSCRECEACGGTGTVKAICYAKEVAESIAAPAYPQGFEHHYWRGEKALRDLVRGEIPKLIFCDSMSDLFAPNVPSEQVIQVLDAMRSAPQHTYQSLTKDAPQILKYLDKLPPNLWVGVSSPPDWFCGKRLERRHQNAMLQKALEVLQEARNKTGCITWMSIEPLSWDMGLVSRLWMDDRQSLPIAWAVVGAASRGKDYFQPDRSHYENVMRLMDEKHVPVFFKGNIRKTVDSYRSDHSASNWLSRWREDFPACDPNGAPIPAVERRQKLCKEHGWTPSYYTYSGERQEAT